MGRAEAVLALRMCMVVRLGKPALRTGRPLAVIATGLPRRHTAGRHHSMIDLRTSGGGSFDGPPRRRPGGWLNTARWAHLSGTRLGRPRRHWLGSLKGACQRNRSHHPDPESTRLPHLSPKEALTHDSIHTSCPSAERHGRPVRQFRRSRKSLRNRIIVQAALKSLGVLLPAAAALAKALEIKQGGRDAQTRYRL
jgi:hypothetical protein